MTRKHFEAIAQQFRFAFADVARTPIESTYDKGYSDGLADMRHRLANVLATTNPAFDRERFLAACEID